MSKKTLYFDNLCGFACYAATEHGKLTEFTLEPNDGGSIIGNIYKGKVCDVLEGMQAAFVNCGLERNCYLSAADLIPDETKYDGEMRAEPKLNLKVGDELMVQVVKAPVGKKGARVTTNLSFVGKYTIYMPETPFVGVSRKITDSELKRNLIFSAGRALKGGEGLIVRTAAPFAARNIKIDEIDGFRNIYAEMKKKFKTAPVGTLLYSDSPLHIRVLRDFLTREIEKIHVGNERLEADVQAHLKPFAPHAKIPVVRHGEKTDMFRECGLDKQIIEMTQPKVELDSGAYLVIEKTEALTVIDVNTGKFIGDDNLEQTVYQTNILAAREIARQVQLRNIGGIIVVDFIDMESENHRAALTEELKNALKNDKAKCRVLPMSKLGLTEFTRKRVGTSPLGFMTKTCKFCRGAGATRSTEFILFELRAKLLELLSQGYGTVCIDMNFDAANKLIAWEAMTESIRAAYPQARVYITSHRTYREDTVNYRVENSPSFSLPEGTVLLY